MNQRNGACIYYWKNGKVKSKVHYKNGRMNGLFQSFYENGDLEEEGNYQYDNNQEYSRKNGSWKRYYPNGGLESEVIYKKGIANSWKNYDQNGNLKAIQEEC